MSKKFKESSIEFGGYFGLDLPDYGDPFPDAIKFQSGRAALRSVLEFASIKKVMLPAYICDSVIEAVIDSGALVETYLLDNTLYPKNLPETLPEGCCFLYVNYFGLCKNNIDRLLQEIPGNQLIIDNSQALLASPVNVLANIYSLRKFIGVPDGGLLMASDINITAPKKEDTNSIGRMKHLLLRLAYSAQDGYPDFVESEEAFRNTKPLKISRLTNRLLSSIDMEKVKNRRHTNFLVLAGILDKSNLYHWKLEEESVPLCYPLVVDWKVDTLKRILAEKCIYLPTYWSDANPRVLHNSIEYQLTNCCLAIPCDQRYTNTQMTSLARFIDSCLHDKSKPS